MPLSSLPQPSSGSRLLTQPNLLWRIRWVIPYILVWLHPLAWAHDFSGDVNLSPKPLESSAPFREGLRYKLT